MISVTTRRVKPIVIIVMVGLCHCNITVYLVTILSVLYEEIDESLRKSMILHTDFGL